VVHCRLWGAQAASKAAGNYRLPRLRDAPQISEALPLRSLDSPDSSGAWGLRFGALVFAPMAQVTIETIKNGPYIVTGEVELIDADGNKFSVEKRMALCRCGASTEKPFCDGTHSKIGFQAAEKAVPESKE
jgi:3-phenylpropionate/trans-cinnamate dioxygenase ferredoxin subunit